MIIYFSASHRHISQDIEVYRTIISSIHRLGHVIANNWLEVAGYEEKGDRPVASWGQICENAKIGIEDADLLIAEATGTSGFGVGYEVGMALANKKPVLVLIKEGEAHDSYVSGVVKESLKIKLYTKNNLHRHLRDFLATLEEKR